MKHRINICCLVLIALSLSITPVSRADDVEAIAIDSPVQDSRVGGLVAIVGSVYASDMTSFSLACGRGNDPEQWILIGETLGEPVSDSRLALWDTRTLPDGTYTLRLRIVIGQDTATYKDIFVHDIVVSNAPRTRTPSPTPLPTATPTVTPRPTSTLTPAPTLSLADMTAALYVAQVDQYEPLCLGRSQYYSIWVSNVGIETLEHVLVTDTLPVNCQPIMDSVTEGAVSDGEQNLYWTIDSLEPGEAMQFQFAVRVPGWLRPGGWLTNRVAVSSDGVDAVLSMEDSLVMDCPEPIASSTGSGVVARPTSTMIQIGTQTVSPTATVVPTRVQVDLPEDVADEGLDLITRLLIGAVIIIGAITVFFLARRLRRMR